VICLIGAFIFLKSLTRPIKKLNIAFQKVASGDFETKVFLKRNDEVKQLADSFNLMTDQTKTLFHELSFQKDNLNSIFASIQEGFAVLDNKGRIILSNESFKNITQNKLVDGKLYWEVIRDVKFGELVKKVRGNKRNLSEELELTGKFYLCSATFLTLREQIVIVFSDITETKNMEKIKRDFVVNVSHELRTPLTAIKGFAETLEEEVDGNAKTYAEVIKRNTDRLISIVQDLLLLSELEEKGSKLESDDVNLTHLVDNVIRIFKSRLTEKGLDFQLSVENGLPVLKGDSFKLEQMLINLLDNAIKYTEKGKVVLALKRKDETVEIIVEDTGIGIPQEHLSRIFERFYVVDKSRSKKLGGTGLGLSIVKHIVLSHKGTIAVESSLTKGTTFTISLPC
jgi:two-component system phosphate regulon sensor histidine kinase PhoR